MLNLHSIRTKLVLFFMILTIIPSAIIATTLFSRSSAIIQDEVGLSIQSKLSQTSDSIDHILNNVDYLTFPALTDNKLYSILTREKKDGESGYQDLQDIGYIRDLLSNLVLGSPYVDSAYLYNTASDSFYFSGLWGKRYKEG